MQINYYQSTSFRGYGIKIDKGGLDYVRNEGGELAVDKLHNAQTQFADSKWKLFINKDGYALKSPTTYKIYTGPFSIKKRFKTGAEKKDTTALMVRMDKDNRIKFPVEFPNLKSLSKVYKAIKNSNGLDKMLLLLAVLDKRSIV